MSVPLELALGIAALMAGFGVFMISLAVCSYVNLQNRMYDDHKKTHEEMKLLAQQEVMRIRQAAEKALEKPDLIAKLQADHIKRTIPVQ